MLAFNRLLNSYRKETAFSEIFDAGFFIAIASLFYFPCITFFIFLCISIIIFRPIIWREWIIGFIGFLMPYVYAAVYYYWLDISTIFWYDKIIMPIVNRELRFTIDSSTYFFLWVIGMICLFSLIKFVSIGNMKQKTKGGLWAFLWFMVISVLSFLVAADLSFVNFTLFTISLPVFIANYFISAKRAWWPEFLTILILSAILYNQFQSL